MTRGAASRSAPLPRRCSSSGCTSFADTVHGPGAASGPGTSTPLGRAAGLPGAARPSRPRSARRGGWTSGSRTTGEPSPAPRRSSSPRTGGWASWCSGWSPTVPTPRPAGNRLVVDGVRGDDVASGGLRGGRAAAPGGLYVVTLDDGARRGEVHRGRTRLHADPRAAAPSTAFGADDGVSWWASGAPLLAWEPGVGWAEDPFVELSGETATSPVMDTSVTVSAPEDLTVLMTGARAEPSAAPGRPPHLDLDASRSPATSASPRASSPPSSRRRRTASASPSASCPARSCRPAGWRSGPSAAIADLEAHVGPFPYRTLTVALLPDYGGRHRVPEHDLRGHAEPPRCSCTRSRTCGSTGWWATPSSATRGWTRRSPRGPRRVVDGAAAASSTGRRSRWRDRSAARWPTSPRRPQLLHRRLRQGRGRAARRPGRRRPGRVRRRDPLLRRRERVDDRDARRRRPRRSPTCPRRSTPLHRRPRPSARTTSPAERPQLTEALSAVASSRCIRATPSTRSSSPRA